MVMKNLPLKPNKNEKGAALMEALIVGPIIVSVLFFFVDLLLFSKSETGLTQAARDAAIYLALTPGTMTQGAKNNINSTNPELIQLCVADPEAVDCPHAIAQQRAFLLLQAQNSYLEVQNASFSTSYDGAKISLTISAPVKIAYTFQNRTITRTVVLKRIGS